MTLPIGYDNICALPNIFEKYSMSKKKRIRIIDEHFYCSMHYFGKVKF